MLMNRTQTGLEMICSPNCQSFMAKQKLILRNAGTSVNRKVFIYIHKDDGRSNLPKCHCD